MYSGIERFAMVVDMVASHEIHEVSSIHRQAAIGRLQSFAELFFE
jgi:hypothetical protein